MFRSRPITALLLAFAALFSSPAMAATTITVTGTFDGTLAGQGFAGQALTFTGTTVADQPDEVFGEFQYLLASLVVTMGGTDLTVGEPAMFFVAPAGSLAGFVDPDASRGLIRFDYAMGNAVLDDALTQAFATSGGALRIGAGSGLNVTGVTLSSAVPEPGAWVVMLVGIGGTGIAMRRRRIVTEVAA